MIAIKIYLRSTIKICRSHVCMSGKVVIVTGANSGIGFELVRRLASRGARVLLACRSEEKGTKARDMIIEETGNRAIVFKKMDLSSLSSIRKFCEDINKTEAGLDVLVNNAGVYNAGNKYTADGIVEEMQVNVFGPFLLTLLLIPLLKKSQPSRILNITSLGNYIGRFDPKKANKIGAYYPIFTYSNTKLCSILFTIELAKRLNGTGVTVNAVHPGITSTNLVNEQEVAISFYKFLCWISYRTVEEAAETPLYMAIARECENVSGKYIVDCAEFMKSWRANDAKAKIFWNYAKKILNCDDDGKIVTKNCES